MNKLDIQRTDEEKLEDIKTFCRDYWLYGVIVVVGAFASVFGINAYRQHAIDSKNTLAEQYETFTQALTDKKDEAAKTALEALQADAPNTSFSTLATLSEAKKQFDQGQYDEAIKQYDWVLSHAKDPAIKTLTATRKIRVLLTQNQYDAALTTIAQTETQLDTASQAFLSDLTILKGDAYLGKEDFDQAISAYQTAVDKDNSNPLLGQKQAYAKILQQKQKTAK